VPGGRAWSELRAAGVREAEFVDAGLVGYAVEFTTVSVFESLDAGGRRRSIFQRS
jgi:hypothetical protein